MLGLPRSHRKVVDYSTKRNRGLVLDYGTVAFCSYWFCFPRVTNYKGISRRYVNIPGMWTLRKILAKFRRKVFSTGLNRKVLLVNHHKVGSALIWNIFEPMAIRIGWIIKNVHGIAETPPRDADVIQLMHGIVSSEFPVDEYRAVRFIRDPRDVIVSGYLYHKRCDEEWCTNPPTNYSDLLYPKVPWPLQHLSQDERENWVDFLNGKSYQQNLIDMEEKEGLVFEMNGYARITIESMLDWVDEPGTLTVRLEDFASDFESTLTKILDWIGLEEETIQREVELAKVHDISSMSDEDIRVNRHISSREITKWDSYFNEELENIYHDLFGEVHKKLGY